MQHVEFAKKFLVLRGHCLTVLVSTASVDCNFSGLQRDFLGSSI